MITHYCPQYLRMEISENQTEIIKDVILQKAGYKTGTILNPDKTPLKGKLVLAIPTDKEQSYQSSMTDSNGRFAIPSPPLNPIYTLVVKNKIAMKSSDYTMKFNQQLKILFLQPVYKNIG